MKISTRVVIERAMDFYEMIVFNVSSIIVNDSSLSVMEIPEVGDGAGVGNGAEVEDVTK